MSFTSVRVNCCAMPDPNAGDINRPRGVKVVAKPRRIREAPGIIKAREKVKCGISAPKLASTTDFGKRLGKALQALLMMGGTNRS